jgi:hypothetical protein
MIISKCHFHIYFLNLPHVLLENITISLNFCALRRRTESQLEATSGYYQIAWVVVCVPFIGLPRASRIHQFACQTLVRREPRIERSRILVGLLNTDIALIGRFQNIQICGGALP